MPRAVSVREMSKAQDERVDGPIALWRARPTDWRNRPTWCRPPRRRVGRQKSYLAEEITGETPVVPRARRCPAERPNNARYAETIARVRRSTHRPCRARRSAARAARHPGRLADGSHAHADSEIHRARRVRARRLRQQGALARHAPEAGADETPVRQLSGRYCALAPLISTSTRRFCARPCGVLLSVIGCVRPLPCVRIFAPSRPLPTK